MDLEPRAVKAIEFCDNLISEQEKVILAGQFTRIEEYRAACAVVRNLRRNRDKIVELFKTDEEEHE